MSLPKPEPSAYFDRKRGVLDAWDLYPEDTQRYFIRNNKRSLAAALRRKALLKKLAQKSKAPKKPRPVLNPETVAKNKAAHARSSSINARNARAAIFAQAIRAWIDEDGNDIPKTATGIPLHRKMVKRFERLYGDLTSVRLNLKRIELRYKSIHDQIAREKKKADYDARHKAWATRRERERIAREKEIAKERKQRAERDRKAAIRQAQRNARTANRKIAFWTKQIAIQTSYIQGDFDYIVRIEPKLQGWKGTSLYYAMKKNVASARSRKARRIERRVRYFGYLMKNRTMLKDAEKFLKSKG